MSSKLRVILDHVYDFWNSFKVYHYRPMELKRLPSFKSHAKVSNSVKIMDLWRKLTQFLNIVPRLHLSEPAQRLAF